MDVGSTFTKGVLVDLTDGVALATAAHPTTLATDVLDGVTAVRSEVERQAGRRADEVLACSSAGGGLRLAVIGYEAQVSAEAGRRVGLSAGARVVHVHAGPLGTADLARLRASRPDVLLLVGGTDGGNGEVLLHNARRLGAARVPLPVVLAGNAEVAGQAADELRRRSRSVVLAANVLPRIGELDPLPARSAIREVFLRHVIGGKQLSRGPAFARMVRAATPDAVLAGVEVLADGDPAGGVRGIGDLIVVDVGGATTDVYSALTPQGEDAGPPRQVVATLWRSRTVEGDLGIRWSAPGVVEAALAERLVEEPEATRLAGYAETVAADPAWLPDDPADDARLAGMAATVALRRHGRAATPAGSPRPLRQVGLLVGSGGVLRHGDQRVREAVLRPLLADHGGGWAVPDRAGLAVDARYLLFAAGLLASAEPTAAARLASQGLDRVG